jgi:hypothetical protein
MPRIILDIWRGWYHGPVPISTIPLQTSPDYIKATSLKNAGILLAKKLVPGRYPFRRNSLVLPQTNELLDLSRPRNSLLNCPIKS